MEPASEGDATAAAGTRRVAKRVLDPYDRLSEVLFGLIMVLTFTGSLSAAESGRAEVKAMLVGALGCNLAWGLIDAIMYLMSCLAERGERLRTFLAVRRAPTPEEARAIIAGAVPGAVAEALSADELEKVRLYLARLPEPPPRPRLSGEDWLGALGVFLLVVLSTVPVVLPFLLIGDPWTALRVSNAVAVVMMFLTGYAFGRIAGWRPLMTGICMVLLGAALVSLTMALGG